MVDVAWLETARVAGDAFERLRATLDDDERAAAARQVDPRTFACARALVRECLSRAVPGVPPAAWTFARTGAGKPFVTGPAPAPAFNLTHTDGLVACALAASEVGIDAEALARGPEILETVRRAFAPSEIAWASTPDRAVELWTVKEAYLKGLGTGISRHLDRFVVAPAAERPAAEGLWLVEESARWRVHARIIEGRWMLATAVGAGETIVVRGVHPA